LNLLDNLVNGLSAFASGATNAKERKKESTLSGRLADGRVNFEDALSHIYPETSGRAQAAPSPLQYQPEAYMPARSAAPLPVCEPEQSYQQSVSVESVTIYESYRGLSARSYESLPAALASLNQGQLSSAERPPAEQEDSVQSQATTYDHLPAQPYQDLTVQTFEETVSSEGPVAHSQNTFENLTRVQQELSQQILGNYVESAASVNREFLDSFISSSREFMDTRGKPAEPAYVPSGVSTSMTSLVDKIFNSLEPYIHEFNQSFRTTDLSITFTPPSVVNENFGYDSSRRPALMVSSYRCRISTTRLALVIRGKEDRIDFFILPVESVMGLSKTEDQHEPLMSFTCEVKNGQYNWEVEEKPLTEERLERYTLLIFEHLMDLTREELLRRPAYAAAL
jgi:hypothetical protein